jgi:hypothetical protein
VAQDYNDIAKDLEHSAVDIKHPEMLPRYTLTRRRG